MVSDLLGETLPFSGKAEAVLSLLMLQGALGY